MIAVEPISAFTDNYIWMLTDGQRAAVVDPGDAKPVLKTLEQRGLELSAVLITHWHPDHTGGIAALCAKWNGIPVYGPAAESAKFPGLTHPLRQGMHFTLDFLSLELEVMEIPGHTLGHIALHGGGLLFCGDTMFSAGCGRLFEGTAQQMHDSLSRLAALPESTAVYCGHEYTLANLAFAAAVEPENLAIADAIHQVKALRADSHPSLPTTIARERRINPFLRSAAPAVRAAAERQSGSALNTQAEVFAALRRWKDGFKAPL
ncbi:MAG: hydroxyacylglutathione hydrolase [Pseudomonadota bacterium]